MTPDKKAKIRKFVYDYRVEIVYVVAAGIAVAAAVSANRNRILVPNTDYETWFVTVRQDLVPEFEPRLTSLMADFGIPMTKGKL